MLLPREGHSRRQAASLSTTSATSATTNSWQATISNFVKKFSKYHSFLSLHLSHITSDSSVIDILRQYSINSTRGGLGPDHDVTPIFYPIFLRTSPPPPPPIASASPAAFRFLLFFSHICRFLYHLLSFSLSFFVFFVFIFSFFTSHVALVRPRVRGNLVVVESDIKSQVWSVHWIGEHSKQAKSWVWEMTKASEKFESRIEAQAKAHGLGGFQEQNRMALNRTVYMTRR